jgi:hypothetical protein
VGFTYAFSNFDRLPVDGLSSGPPGQRHISRLAKRTNVPSLALSLASGAVERASLGQQDATYRGAASLTGQAASPIDDKLLLKAAFLSFRIDVVVQT